MFSEPSLLDYASRGGIIGMLVVILYGGFRKEPWWVFGWVYRDLLVRYNRRGEQLDKWFETSRRALTTAEAQALALVAKEQDPNDQRAGR